jgi:hypothetical protein
VISDGGQAMILVTAWAKGDPEHFRHVALQIAAHHARNGEEQLGRNIRNALDAAFRVRSYLPKYSGAKTFCSKCESCQVNIKYMKEGDTEFLERECAQCGRVWYERCADAD